MTTLIQADIFFFITAIAVVVIAIVLTIALVYAIRVLKNAGYISEKLKSATDDLSSDLHDLRKNAREEGSKIKHFLSLVKVPKKRTAKAKKDESKSE
jgi:uncharacterized protein YoxC